MTIFECSMWNVVWSTMIKLALICSTDQSISVAMEHWSTKHCAFVVETFFKNNDSVIVTQCAFCNHFSIHQNNCVPSHNAIPVVGVNFQEMASAMKKRPPEKQHTVQTLENVNHVHHVILRSPW